MHVHVYLLLVLFLWLSHDWQTCGLYHGERYQSVAKSQTQFNLSTHIPKSRMSNEPPVQTVNVWRHMIRCSVILTVERADRASKGPSQNIRLIWTTRGQVTHCHPSIFNLELALRVELQPLATEGLTFPHHQQLGLSLTCSSILWPETLAGNPKWGD